MLTSELIGKLLASLAQSGDLEVVCYSDWGSIHMDLYAVDKAEAERDKGFKAYCIIKGNMW